MNKQELHDNSKITRHSVLLIGAAMGFLVGVSLLSGDDAGRVNILLLLLMFVLIPVFGVLLSLFSFSVKQFGSHLRLNELVLFLGKYHQTGPTYNNELRRLVLLFHSQYGAVGWALGSIAALMCLLVFTDVNFVWRSTVLTSEVLMPLLEVIAMPWFFWESAQPTKSLLMATQDSRLVTHQDANIAFSQWWPFILACQLFYAFLLRAIAMLLLRLLIGRCMMKSTEVNEHTPQDRKARIALPEKAISEELPDEFVVINWAGFSTEVILQIDLALIDKSILLAGPLAGDNLHWENLPKNQFLLVLVKAWEPPLEELRDYLRDRKGLITPVDIKKGKVMTAQEHHIEEWNRSISDMPDWALYVKRSMQS